MPKQTTVKTSPKSKTPKSKTLPTTFEELQAHCRHAYVQPCCGRKKCQANYVPCAKENCPGFGEDPVSMDKLISNGDSP